MNKSHQQLVSKCRDLSKKTLSSLLQGFFDKIELALNEDAGIAEANLKSDYIQAIQEINRAKDSMVSTFKKEVFDGYDAFWMDEEEEALSMLNNPESELQTFDLDHLGLVAESDMEETLTIANIVAKVENKFTDELLALNKRFAFLLNLETLSNEDNPLGVKALADAFLASMKKLILKSSEEENNIIIRLAIYKNFNLYFFKYIGAFYDELNELLHLAGIEPKVPSKFRSNPVSPSVMRRMAEEEKEAAKAAQMAEMHHMQQNNPDLMERFVEPPPMYGYAQNIQAPAFNQVAQLIHQQSQVLNGIVQQELVNPDIPAMPPQQLSNVIAGMQNQALMAGGAIAGLRNSIHQTIQESGAEPSVNQEDQDAIDVISMLFDFILDDPNLPDKMRVLLSRLQIPMLKVAILDKSFFSNKNHAARTLLNNLAQASIGIMDGDPLHKPMQRRIETIVSRILDEFSDDVSLFTQLDEEFSQFLEKENKMAKVAETRTTQATQGQDKRKLAKAKVAEAINSRVKGKRLPRVVKKLLTEPWNTLLNLAYLKGGEEGEEWQKGIKVIERLTWTLSGTTEPTERKKIIKTIPGLLIEIRDGLKSISYKQQEMVLLLKGLQEAHVVSLRQSSPDKAEQIKPVKPHSPEIADAITLEEVAEDEELVESPILLDEENVDLDTDEISDEFIKKANAMEVGTWLEWDDEEGQHLRGKLSWKSDVTGIFVFVNRKGIKIAEMQASELAVLLKNEKATDLQDTAVPLMDRALTAMVDALQKSADIATIAESDTE